MRRIRDQFTGILDNTLLPVEHQPEQDFALVLNAPPEVAQAIDDVRRRYDPAFKAGILPHITIKRPSALGIPEKLPLVQEALREGLAGHGAIQVQLEGYGIFNKPGTSVVFLKLRDETPFITLHRRAITALSQVYPDGLADQYEGQNYHPHLTIGNELSDLDLAVLEHELATGSFKLDFSFTFTQVTLFVQAANQPWRTLEEINFAGGQA